jgi:hypothetical protein
LWPDGIVRIPCERPEPVEALPEIPDKAMGLTESLCSARGLAPAKHAESSFEVIVLANFSRRPKTFMLRVPPREGTTSNQWSGEFANTIEHVDEAKFICERPFSLGVRQFCGCSSGL